MLVPLSLIVPLFNATAFAPIESTSPALVAALAAAIANVNTNSFEPVPLAYESVWFARWSLTTVSCGVPVTSTASLNTTVTESVPPSDLSNAVMFQSISVISAAPNAVVRPEEDHATKTSCKVLEPTVFASSQP